MRRCPRISASSCMPPIEMRANLRPSERAIERPSDVLPTPGGPTKQRMGPLSTGLELQHGEVIENAVLDLFEIVVVFVEDLGRALHIHRFAG